MSNKKKILENNTDLQSILTTIRGLPAQENVRQGAYVWKKLSAQGGTFLDFVVSDQGNAYPEAGTQGGYWYEKVVEGIKGCSVTFITPSSWNEEITVQHTLGKTPSAVAVCRIKGSSADFSHQNVLCAANTSTPGYNNTNFFGAAYSYSTAYGLGVQKFTCTDNEVIFEGGSAYLEVGVTYAVIAME